MKFWGEKHNEDIWWDSKIPFVCIMCMKKWNDHTILESVECMFRHTIEELKTIGFSSDEINRFRVMKRDLELSRDSDRQRRIPTLPKNTADIEEDDSELFSSESEIDSWIDSAIPNDSEKSENESEPLKILKIRFAKGEITKEEFIEMKRMLE